MLKMMYQAAAKRKIAPRATTRIAARAGLAAVRIPQSGAHMSRGVRRRTATARRSVSLALPVLAVTGARAAASVVAGQT
jgi:hypothetical protein